MFFKVIFCIPVQPNLRSIVVKLNIQIYFVREDPLASSKKLSKLTGLHASTPSAERTAFH